MRKLQFTHGFLQQLFQAVDVWSVSSLPLHHHAVAAAGETREKEAVFKRFGINVLKPWFVITEKSSLWSVDGLFARGRFQFLDLSTPRMWSKQQKNGFNYQCVTLILDKICSEVSQQGLLYPTVHQTAASLCLFWFNNLKLIPEKKII